MKKWIALLLVVVLTMSLFPTVTAAEKKADSSDIWAEIARIEDSVINAETAQTEAAAAAYAANVDEIIAAVEASDAYVPGSIIRHGDFFYFTTTDGQVNGYSPRLRAAIRSAKATGADPEAVSGVETTSFATRGGWPDSKDVAVFQPYYGLDSNFTNQYPNEGVSIAQATGGTSTTYKTNDATIDAIADAIESCGVVIFDSHGDTDYSGPNDDFTSRANTSYICLQSGTGITSADQAAVTGPYGTYHHAYYAGSGYGGMKYYCVDGTAISNHMEQNSPNGLLWMAICLGMATDGLEAPMRDRGVEVVYGYSQSVTFAGDFAWEAVFWDEMIAGKNVAASISKMKSRIGCPDPYTSNYPAWPIVVSDEDNYPGHGNVDAAQTVKSTWTLYQNFKVTAFSGDESRGTVSVDGTTITAMPKVGCYTSGYEVTSGVATVEQNGDVLEVTPESDCVIRVDFADKNPAALTYHVPEGVTFPAPYQGYENDSVTIAAPTGTPTADGEEYYFYGWATAEVADVDVLPENTCRPGDSLTLPAGQTNLYALYSYFKSDDPYAVGQFIRVDAEPESWEGEIVITHDSQKALDASGKYIATKIGSKEAAVDLADANVEVSGNYLVNVPQDLVYVVTKGEDGYYRLRMRNSDSMLTLPSNTNTLSTTKSEASQNARWTMEFVNGSPVIRNVSFNTRSIQYSSSWSYFHCYENGEKEALTLYRSIPGKTMYATVLRDKIVCETHSFTDWNVTVEPTCVAEGRQNRYCTVCGFAEAETLPIDPNHHTGNTEQNGAVAPTCTEDGKEADTYCVDCGAKLTEGAPIPATGHTPAEAVKENEKAAACTEAGSYDSVVYCSVCKAEISRETVEVEALGHDWGEYDVTKPATCTEAGEGTHTCARCGETETRPIEATGHTPAEAVKENEKAAACTEAGSYDSVVYCSVCKAEISREHTEIPAIGHSYGKPTWKWNSTNTKATATFTCANCGDKQVVNAKITEKVTKEAAPHVEGSKKLTAKVTFEGAAYTKSKTVKIAALPCPCAKFTDMPAYGTDEHAAIDWAFAHDPQITAGTSKTKFSPSETVTRAQAMTFLWRAAGCPEPTTTKNPFTDVTESKYFYKAVLWAIEKGITVGTTKTTFSPNDTCNIEQIITFLYRYEGSPKVGNVNNPFTDVVKGKYYYKPIMWAYSNGIYAGKSTTVFGRTDDCQRVQIVTFLWRNDKR